MYGYCNVYPVAPGMMMPMRVIVHEIAAIVRRNRDGLLCSVSVQIHVSGGKERDEVKGPVTFLLC